MLSVIRSEIFFTSLVTCLLRSGRFSFLFPSSLFSSGTNWRARGRCYGYISPGLPVGAAHLLSREVLILAARPTSDLSEVDHVTMPLQRQAGSALASLVDSLSHCGVVRLCSVLLYFEILILLSHYLLHPWFVFYL